MDVRRAERASGRTKCDVPSRASGRCREIDRLFSECGGRVDQRGSHSCSWHLKPRSLALSDARIHAEQNCRWQKPSALLLKSAKSEESAVSTSEFGFRDRGRGRGRGRGRLKSGESSRKNKIPKGGRKMRDLTIFG